MFGLELFGIWLPILYHVALWFLIWFRGDSNVGDYPWTGNWMYTPQRWTGGFAFFYIVWHTWHLRFSGIHLLTHPDAAFGKVQTEFAASLGDRVLCRGNLLRFVAFCLWPVAVCSEMGNHVG